MSKIIGPELKNIPWQDKPEGYKMPVWRYTNNPIIGRYDQKNSNSIFNSAVVPFGDGFAGVFRCDSRALPYMPSGVAAGADDFDTEFLDYILGVAVVDDVHAAVAHIAAHSTHHSEAIVTRDDAAASAFVSGVDSAAVYVNASTRFTDGGEFGLGCEMGISTQKLHARGPMGLRELTVYKYVITGCGQVR